MIDRLAESVEADPHCDPTTVARLLVVVVLYRCSIASSSTCTSLLSQHLQNNRTIRLYVHDNSPAALSVPPPSGWLYYNDSTNGGLPSAYNRAIEQAKLFNAEWLLLLDQDSALPDDFLFRLQATIAKCNPQPDIAAIVPLITSHGRQISPVQPAFALDRPYKIAGTIPSAWLSAINSAAAIRIPFLESIGGFTYEFWLDYLDHWLFRKIYDEKCSVFVTDQQVQHDLSVANFNQGIEESRYANVLKAEADFTNHYLPPYWRLLLLFRFLARAPKHAIRTHNKRIAALILQSAWRQLRFLFS